jgi:hypothetical protein
LREVFTLIRKYARESTMLRLLKHSAALMDV